MEERAVTGRKKLKTPFELIIWNVTYLYLSSTILSLLCKC